MESGKRKTQKGKGGIDVITPVMSFLGKKIFMFTAATSEYAYIFKHFDHFYMLSAVLISSTLLEKKAHKIQIKSCVSEQLIQQFLTQLLNKICH